MAGERKVHRYGELDALYFDKLPQRAKEIFFEFLSPCFPTDCYDKYNVMEILDLEFPLCESPIEIIFALAYNLMEFSRKDITKSIYLYPQYEIHLKKNYRVDFYYDSGVSDDNENSHDLRLAIECDGHDSHSSKSQIKYDNERDIELKMAGYDVLHFSGSQIYEDPFGCANTVIDYILSKTK